MRSVEFDCWIDFGEGETDEWTLEFDVEEEEFRLLQEMRLNGESFEECESLSRLYKELYDSMVEEETEDLLEEDEELAAEHEDDDWRADDDFELGIELSDDFDMDDYDRYSCKVTAYLDDEEVATCELYFYATKEEDRILRRLYEDDIKISDYDGLEEVQERLVAMFDQEYVNEVYEGDDVDERIDDFEYELGVPEYEG